MSPAFIQIHMVNTVGECISLILVANFGLFYRPI